MNELGPYTIGHIAAASGPFLFLYFEEVDFIGLTKKEVKVGDRVTVLEPDIGSFYLVHRIVEDVEWQQEGF